MVHGVLFKEQEWYMLHGVLFNEQEWCAVRLAEVVL